MQVQVMLYGAMRVVAARQIVDLSFDKPSVELEQLLQALIAAYPRIRSYLLDDAGMLHSSVRVLLNTKRIDPDAKPSARFHDGDSITLLTPVAGGALSSFGLSRINMIR